ncbi:MAG: GNAT family N-acetyltransferase [Bacteroidales bacterium]|nr:GNAT family N-acetyltransferase [Bacteroidales bacterium]MCF8455071.1 GNAT family N-acetyltransferase [Bacteroidales bacterium]
MEFTVRLALATEANIIKDFQIKMALETEDLKLDTVVVEKGVTAVFEDETKGNYWVAETKDQIIGSMLMTPEWSDWRNSTVLWFQSVYVLPEFRGKGVFRQMYLNLQEFVKNSVQYGGLRLYVDKDNISAQKVYEKLGMDGDHYRFYEWMKDF